MLTIALAAVPTMLTVLIGILLNNSRLSDVNSRLGEFRSHMDARFNDVDRRFDEIPSFTASKKLSTPVLKHLEHR